MNFYTAEQTHRILRNTAYDLYNSIPELARAGRAPEWAVYAVGVDGNRHGYIRLRAAGQDYINGQTVQIFDRVKVNRLAGRNSTPEVVTEKRVNIGRWFVGIAELFASLGALAIAII